MEFTKENYVLIKSDLPGGYKLASKTDSSTFVIIDDTQTAIDAIESLIADGATVYSSEEEYKSKVKGSTSEEQLYNSLVFWEKNVPKEEWPEGIKKLIDKKHSR